MKTSHLVSSVAGLLSLTLSCGSTWAQQPAGAPAAAQVRWCTPMSPYYRPIPITSSMHRGFRLTNGQ